MRFTIAKAAAKVIESEVEFRELLAKTADHPPGYLNLLITTDLSALGGLAKAAGIPGLPLRPGGQLSGLAVEISKDMNAFDAGGGVMASATLLACFTPPKGSMAWSIRSVIPPSALTLLCWTLVRMPAT